MIIGQTIVAEDQTGTTVYTPWFPRQGDACRSTLDVIAISASGQFDVDMQTKNSEDTDATTPSSMGDTSNATSTTTFNCSGAKELCRYKITLQHSSGTGTVYGHFRMLSPSWLTTGVQGV
ncbi:MAG: hypothetical protein KDA21_01680 [Phycisphaerales bacterium]|nr:hypothetical protein [Phycisphaerales bacterium]